MREASEVVVDLGGGVEHRVPVVEVDVGGARGVFSGAGTAVSTETGEAVRDDGPGEPGNCSQRRPHRPDVLAATREAVLGVVGADARDGVWMDQVHGGDVGVAPDGPGPHEVRGVDALVAGPVDGARPPALVVRVADCVPVLLASEDGRTVGVAHAGRQGLASGVVDAVVEQLRRRTDQPISAVIGPSICGRCYEVPLAMREAVAEVHPVASDVTSRGTPALDLPGAVRHRLWELLDVEPELPPCTLCDDGWFSHRRDAATGRQVGVVRAAA